MSTTSRTGVCFALEVLLDISKAGSPAMWGWSLGEAWADFLSGNAIMTFSWGDVGSMSMGGALGTVAMLGYVLLSFVLISVVSGLLLTYQSAFGLRRIADLGAVTNAALVRVIPGIFPA